MTRWSRYCTDRIKDFRNKPHAAIADEIDKSPKAVSEYLRRKGMLKCPGYTETELFLLQNFPAKQCLPFIQHKSINALKIKQCRLKRSIPASASTR